MDRVLFLDTETTGLENGRLVQLAYKNRKDSEIIVEYFKPPVPIEFDAMATHHITEKKVADKPPFAQTETKKIIAELLQEGVLVAHNAKYDIGILKTEEVATHKFICTYKVAYSMYDYPNHKLQTLRYRWGIDIESAVAHDASGDVMVLAEVFEYMLKDYMSRHGVTEEEAILKFIEISSAPTLLKTLSFGKLRGMTFEEIKEKEFSYLQWLGTLTDKEEDFMYTVNYHLGRLATGSGNKNDSVAFESDPF